MATPIRNKCPQRKRVLGRGFCVISSVSMRKVVCNWFRVQSTSKNQRDNWRLELDAAAALYAAVALHFRRSSPIFNVG